MDLRGYVLFLVPENIKKRAAKAALFCARRPTEVVGEPTVVERLLAPALQ